MKKIIIIGTFVGAFSIGFFAGVKFLENDFKKKKTKAEIHMVDDSMYLVSLVPLEELRIQKDILCSIKTNDA